MMTISFGGALLLLPVIILAKFITIAPIVCLGWFLMVAGLMFLEHIRRTKLLGLGWLLTIAGRFTVWLGYTLN
jgi:hypothetical protein